MKYKPHPYQGPATQHILTHPAWAEWLDMGLGKTVITLTAIAQLLDRGEIRGALIVAPLRVCQQTWPAEIKLWDHTKALSWVSLCGSKVFAEHQLTTSSDVFLCNFENLPRLCAWMAEHTQLPFDMIVFDESSKMKSPSSVRFKALKRHLPRFSRRGILSATPALEGYEGLWSQYFCIDQGKRLGAFVTHYRQRYFQDADYMGYKQELKDGAGVKIEKLIADCTLTMSAKDHLRMPELVSNTVWVDLPAKCVRQYMTLEREMYLKLERGEIDAINKASWSSKARQFTSGAVYTTDVMGNRTDVWEVVHTVKIDALADIIDDAQGTPILVGYNFKHERQRLQSRFKHAEVFGRGKRSDRSIIERWNAGKIPLLLAHPASAGHGLNIQFGGHILVYLSTPWSGEHYTQLIGRLHRQGQRSTVFVHHIQARNTVDALVRAKVEGKIRTQDDFKAAMKR